jgi:flagellar biosynthesis/type III secretory pathway protein FliH
VVEPRLVTNAVVQRVAQEIAHHEGFDDPGPYEGMAYAVLAVVIDDLAASVAQQAQRARSVFDQDRAAYLMGYTEGYQDGFKRGRAEVVAAFNAALAEHGQVIVEMVEGEFKVRSRGGDRG